MIARVFRLSAANGAGPLTGRALHGRFFAEIAARDPALARRLHEPDRPRPFAWAVLPGDGVDAAGGLPASAESGARREHPGTGGQAPSGTGTADAVIDVRLALFSREIEALFGDAPHWPVGSRIEIDGRPRDVVAVFGPGDGHPWAGGAEPAAGEMIASDFDRLLVEFATPTAFRAGDVDRLQPDAGFIIASWVRSWNAFAGRPIPPVTAAELENAVRLLEDRTRVVRDDPHVPAPGFVGEVVLTASPSLPPAGRAALRDLAEFAFHCGTGRKTAMGMGLTRVRV